MSKRYSEEFKRKAVELYLSRGKDTDVATELGIARSSLFAWHKKYQDELNPVLVSDAEELRRLRKENARLAEENEILKKAAAFFAREHLPK